jgi:hypothetical protein
LRRSPETTEGKMPLTQSEREAAGAMEGMPREEDSVEAEEVEEAKVAKESVDLQTTPKENKGRSLSLSRNPSLREELSKSRNRRCHHRRLTRTWPT